MNILKILWQKTLLYKTYRLFSTLIYYIRDTNLISDTLYSDEFKFVIKRYLMIDIKKDWLGRLYGVINPNIDINGEFNINNVIIELDGDKTNNNEYVKTWIYKQMRLIGYLFKIDKLYDYINIEFEHVGPINQDNYLIIFDIVSRKEFTNSVKKFGIHFACYSILILICYLFITYIV